MKLKEKLINLVIQKPKTVIIISLFLTFLFSYGIKNTTFNDNMVDMLPEDIHSRVTLDKFEDKFGRPDFVMLGIGVKEGTVFNFKTLKKLQELTGIIQNVPGIDKVDSFSTLNQIKGREWGLEVKPFMDELPQTKEELVQLEKEVFEDDTFVGTYVSESKKYTTIIGTTMPDADEIEVYHALQKIKEQAYGPGVDEAFITGMPILRSYISEGLKGDLRKFMPFVVLVLIVVLYLSIRTITGVIFTLVIIICSYLPTLGLMGHLNKPIMMINNAMPVIILAIACADSIHIITKFYHKIKTGVGKEVAVRKTMEELTLPVVVTSITTMAGFVSLLTTPIPKIGEFGLFIAFGVFWALFLSLTLLPAMLMLTKEPQFKATEEEFGKGKAHPDIVDKFLHGLADLVMKHKVTILVSTVILIVVCIFGMFRVQVETNPTAWLDVDSEYMHAARAADKHFGGSINMSLMIESDIKDPAILNSMVGFQEYLKSLPEIGKSFSIADVVKRLNKAINNNQDIYKVIPENRAQVAQALLLYSFSGDPSDFERMVDNEYETAALNIRLGDFNTRKVRELVSKIKKKYNSMFPKTANIEATGTAIFVVDLDPLVVRSAVVSLLAALIVVIVINGIAYKSFLVGFFSAIPLGLAIIINFGVMGWFGIDLSMPLAMLSCMVIGIGVDYAVHYAASYKRISHYIEDKKEKTKQIFESVGRPILFNAASVASGFLVLTLSIFTPVKYLGLLIALSMVSCCIGALTVLAAILYITDPKV
ncbi:RND family transporter [Candidatus Margulisiibacteriota bacterium]